MRPLFVCAAIVLVFLSVDRASADDNAGRLVQLFAKTCATKPFSVEALDAQARGLGYVHQNGPVPADDPKRDYDDIHSWRLRDAGTNFAVSTYFIGPRAHFQVICSMSASDVAAPALLAVLERETALQDPQSTKLDSEKGITTYIWTTEEDGEHETLEVRAGTGERASLSLSYFVRGH